MAGNDCGGDATSMAKHQCRVVNHVASSAWKRAIEMLQMRYPSPIAVASVRVRCSDHNARSAAAAAQIGTEIGSAPIAATIQ